LTAPALIPTCSKNNLAKTEPEPPTGPVCPKGVNFKNIKSSDKYSGIWVPTSAPDPDPKNHDINLCAVYTVQKDESGNEIGGILSKGTYDLTVYDVNLNGKAGIRQIKR
jgi:hypothetical protein